MIYQFKPGTRINKQCDPQKIGEKLESIRVANGGKLLVADVIADAAKPKSPLHPAFLWDDAAAASNYREVQARSLIRGVISISEASGQPEHAFWSVVVSAGEDEPGERYYQSAAVVSQSPREYTAALKLLLVDFEGIERSLQELKSLAGRGKRRPVAKALQHIAAAQKELV